MTQLDRIRRMLPKALWIEACDLAPEVELRRHDCRNLAACASTFEGPRKLDVPDWRCPAACPDFEAKCQRGRAVY